MHLKDQYSKLVNSLIQRLETRGARERVRCLLSVLRAKKPSTSDGKKRKERILDRLFYQHKKTILQVRFYQASMHKMKSFVLKYQPKEPLTHQLHYDLSQLAREFLVKFVEPKCLKGVAPKNLRDLNLTESMNKNDVEIFLGRDTRDIFNVTKQNVPEDFMARVKKSLHQSR